jgi:hypothetical protein
MNAVARSILMQYQTPLPDNTEFAKIRDRVNEIAPIFDRLPGMWFKLYGVNDSESAAIAEYSSIYLWDGPEPMHDFLSSDLFQNYSAAFGRPTVRWFLVHAVRGDISSVVKARYAIRRLAPFPRHAHVAAVLGDWQTKFHREGALVQITGFDSANWEMIDLTVWDKIPELRDLDHRYTLARVSAPESCHNFERQCA